MDNENEAELFNKWPLTFKELALQISEVCGPYLTVGMSRTLDVEIEYATELEEALAASTRGEHMWVPTLKVMIRGKFRGEFAGYKIRAVKDNPLLWHFFTCMLDNGRTTYNKSGKELRIDMTVPTSAILAHIKNDMEDMSTK